jgi:hypothetical protein
MGTPPRNPLRLVVHRLHDAQDDGESGHIELQARVTSGFIQVVQVTVTIESAIS